MNKKALAAVERELDRWKIAQVNAREIQALAKKLGRKPENRGKEPTWVSMYFPNLPPLTIPSHGGRDIPIGTKMSIINALRDDVLEWESEFIKK